MYHSLDGRVLVVYVNQDYHTTEKKHGQPHNRVRWILVVPCRDRNLYYYKMTHVSY